jgi:hypothetical protein
MEKIEMVSRWINRSLVVFAVFVIALALPVIGPAAFAVAVERFFRMDLEYPATGKLLSVVIGALMLFAQAYFTIFRGR